MGSSSGIGFVRIFLGFLEERVLKVVVLEGRDCGDGGVDGVEGMVIGLFMIGKVLTACIYEMAELAQGRCSRLLSSHWLIFSSLLHFFSLDKLHINSHETYF